MKQLSDSSEEQRTSVFISHSRKDKDFVGHLKEALEERGYGVWVDVEDILPTEDWLAEVYSGIEKADDFVFVISPDSVRSEDCQRELDHAVENNKRLVPIVYQTVPDEEVPQPLGIPEWIFFRDGDGFDSSLQTLTEALNTDLEWVHAHTRLLTRAIEWDANGRDKSFVLRGTDLRTAEEWQVRAADKEPKLTALQSEYVFASRKDAMRRQRLVLFAVIFGLIVTMILGSIAFWQWNVAKDQRQEAIEQRNVAIARQLAAQSEVVLTQERNLLLGVLLAVESMRRSPSLAADQSLRDGLKLLSHNSSTLAFRSEVQEVAFSPDGRYVAAASWDGTAKVYETATGQEVSSMEHVGGGRRRQLQPGRQVRGHR